MSTLGRTVSIKGELLSDEDITIEGHIDGLVHCEGCAVRLAPGCTVTGDVVARDIHVEGSAAGQLIATEVVDVRAGAEVSGRVIAGRFILEVGGWVSGRVEPQHLEAALRVIRFRQRQREAAGA